MKARVCRMMAVMISAALLMAGLAMGQTGVDKRQKRQQKRIAEGVHSGELNKKEALKLERAEAKIRRKERRAKADGDFTAKERAKEHKALNKTSRKIYKQKHDGQTRQTPEPPQQP